MNTSDTSQELDRSIYRDSWLYRIRLAPLVATVAFLWVAFLVGLPLMVRHAGLDVTTLGQIGDSFGLLNSLFSGLALTGVVYALSLQQRQTSIQVDQLSLQQEELRNQREELRRAALALEMTSKEAATARSAQAVIIFAEILNGFAPLRFRLYEFPSDFTHWNQEQVAIARQVADECQRLSWLCLSGILDEKFVIEPYCRAFARPWDKLEDFIKSFRERSGEPRELSDGAYVYQHFERFARTCIRFDQRKRAALVLPSDAV